MDLLGATDTDLVEVIQQIGRIIVDSVSARTFEFFTTITAR